MGTRASGSNVLPAHEAGAWSVLAAQLASPVLLLLAGTALVALLLHDSTDAAIILSIVLLTVGLGFTNEYRARRVIADLNRRLRRSAVVLRDGKPQVVDAATLVCGDLIVLRTGDVVPADARLHEARNLECDEAVLSGESLPLLKDVDHEASSRVFAGTVVRAGSGVALVDAVGRDTALGRIAAQSSGRLPETAFQRGLRGVTTLLAQITAVVAVVVFAVNAVLRHDPIESLLFSLAIAVSLTPQLLPAIVTVSLASGARRMAARQVLVKRLVTIEDLGNIEVLFTDKTGTLTVGELEFSEAVDPAGVPSSDVLRWALLCASGGAEREPLGMTEALDAAVRRAPAAAALDLRGYPRLDEVPFDHTRRRMSVLVAVPDGDPVLIVKGAPESVLAACRGVPDGVPALLEERFAAGYRVVAIATRTLSHGATATAAAEERDLTLTGLLVFTDPPRLDAGPSMARLAEMGVCVKILTGDNALVAGRVCTELGIAHGPIVTGAEVDALSDAGLAALLPATTIFARVSPEQKARIIRVQRRADVDVGFLGDGVNDALALHDADVGISVESAADVARDAADVVLVTKDLGILADGVLEGRRIFANTVKYVLMAASSNFGNMISTAGISLVLPFLPLLPSQVLLNNLLYDGSEMTIPTDRVDAEQLLRPAHWDTGLIGRFMLVFGPISSLGDLATFGALILLFHAGPATFRSGYFIESFITQTLIVLAIRTRTVPFFRSRPSWPLVLSTLGVTAIGVTLPVSPFAEALGFGPLPAAFAWVIAAVACSYVLLVEVAKLYFFRKIPVAAELR